MELTKILADISFLIMGVIFIAFNRQITRTVILMEYRAWYTLGYKNHAQKNILSKSNFRFRSKLGYLAGMLALVIGIYLLIMDGYIG